MSDSLTTTDVAAGLVSLGLKRGDSVLVHSSLSSLGPVDDGAESVVAAFLHILGPSGTLLVPTFGDFGAIAAAVKTRSDAVHSIHPRASVAAVGARAEQICRDHWKADTAHGENTPYTRLADLGGYVCLLGVDQDRNTTLHAVEALLRLPYLRTTQEITFSTPEGEVTKSWPFFPGPHRDFIGLDRILRERGILRAARIGNSVVRLMSSRETIDCLLEIGRRDPAFALCRNPNCGDCVEPRAALGRQPFASESFALVAAASLAGNTVREIVANCATTGIDAVELDRLGDRPASHLPPEELAAAIRELQAEGCVVTALRGANADSAGPLVHAAAECGVQRVVLPLSGRSAAHVTDAGQFGVSLSFYNVNATGSAVFDTMRSLQSDMGPVSLTFNAANFARIGEKPFLTSYGNRLKRFVDQLDVEDCTFGGSETPLAGGNAEILELVSILRCSSFGGVFLLGAGNRSVTDLKSTKIRLEDLLLAL